MIKFHFFAHSCPALPTPFVEEAIFTPFHASVPFVKYQLTHTDLGLFLGSLFCSIGLCACFYASTRLFDYSGLLIQLDIRYCDPSYFALLSQNWCSYSGSFMVPYKLFKHLSYSCEICHWYFNSDCVESINCYG